MIKIIFYRCLLGWHIVCQRKTTKKKVEYQIRAWKPIGRGAKSRAVKANEITVVIEAVRD